MKDGVRILGVIILAVVYCFGVGFAFNSPTNSFSENARQDQYLAVSPNYLFSHTSPSEAAFNSLINYPAPNFESKLDKYGLVAKTIENVNKIQFGQYFNFSIKLLIQLRKMAITFPFHHFW